MKTKLFLIIAMFLSGTGVLAEELPARGLAPVNKTTHQFFFQYLEDLTYDLYVNYRPPKYFAVDDCEVGYRITIKKDGSFDDTNYRILRKNSLIDKLNTPSLDMIKSVVKPFYPQMNYDELNVDISLCKTKENDIQFMYFTKDNRGGNTNGLVDINIYKDYRQLNKKTKDKKFILTCEQNSNNVILVIYGKLKDAHIPGNFLLPGEKEVILNPDD